MDGAGYEKVLENGWNEDNCNGQNECLVDTTSFGLRDDDWLYINFTCLISSTRMALEDTVEVTPLPIDISGHN